MRILVLTPHADDETLWMGWTIAKYVEDWNDIRVLLFTTPENDIREKEFYEAMKVLWASYEKPLFPWMDTKLYTIEYWLMVNKIDKEINNFKPHKVYIPAKSVHQDHEIVNKVALTALRISLKKRYNVPEVYEYWYPPLIWYPEWWIPNVVEFLEEKHLKKKIEAFKKYKSQYNNESWANEKWIIEYALYCWYWWWEKYWEQFRLLRMLKF